MKKIINLIRRNLQKQADKKTKASFQRFFKEKVKFYGVRSTKMNKIAKDSFNMIKKLDKDKFIDLMEELFSSGYCEEATLAADLTNRYVKKFISSDITVFERWINKYIDNWAKCDTLCNHAIGTFIETFPKHLSVLFKWTKSKNRWVKRAAAVTLILPARKGLYLQEIFRISDNLLTDKDDMVQKGYGWLLKEASKKHLDEVFNYVISHKENMPRTALRYAIEKMPVNLRKKAMQK